MDNRSVYQKHQAGKGSRRRPTDEERFQENFERIFPDKQSWLENRDLSWLDEKETDGPET